MNQWDEAARKARKEIQSLAEYHGDTLSDRTVEEVITKHFAQLRDTYQKLVELAEWCMSPVDYDNPNSMADDYRKFEQLKSEIKAEIEREK